MKCPLFFLYSLVSVNVRLHKYVAIAKLADFSVLFLEEDTFRSRELVQLLKLALK